MARPRFLSSDFAVYLARGSSPPFLRLQASAKPPQVGRTLPPRLAFRLKTDAGTLSGFFSFPELPWGARLGRKGATPRAGRSLPQLLGQIGAAWVGEAQEVRRRPWERAETGSCFGVNFWRGCRGILENGCMPPDPFPADRALVLWWAALCYPFSWASLFNSSAGEIQIFVVLKHESVELNWTSATPSVTLRLGSVGQSFGRVSQSKASVEQGKDHPTRP